MERQSQIVPMMEDLKIEIPNIPQIQKPVETPRQCVNVKLGM